MSLNIPLNHNVKKTSKWLQQSGKILTGKSMYINQIRENELNEKGNGDEISDETSSMEEVSATGCLSAPRFNCDFDSQNQFMEYQAKEICDNTTQCVFLNKFENTIQEFEEIKSCLMLCTKPTPCIVKMLKKFIRTHENGKYISRGIQADININFYKAPKSSIKESIQRSYLEKLYAPLKDTYVVDVIKHDERPMTSPCGRRTKKSSECNTGRLKLIAALVNVTSNISETLLVADQDKRKGTSNTLQSLKISHIPKLIQSTNNEKRRNKNQNDAKKCVKPFSGHRLTTEILKTKAKQKEEVFTTYGTKKHQLRATNNNKLSNTPAIQLKTCASKQKISKIPIPDMIKENQKKFQTSISNVKEPTGTKTDDFVDEEFIQPVVPCCSITTVVSPPVKQKILQHSSNESVQDENSKPNEFLASNNLKPKPSPTKENDNVWLSIAPSETNSVSTSSNCSLATRKTSSKLKLHPHLPSSLKSSKRNKSDTNLDDSCSTTTHETAIFRTKKDIEKQKRSTKESPLKIDLLNNVSSEIGNKHSLLDDLKCRLKVKEAKLPKKEKIKQCVKVDKNYNDRFILDSKITYVLKNNASYHKISRLNIKHSAEKPKRERGIDLNHLTHNRNSTPVEKPKKYFHPRTTKFGTYPRHYEDLKRYRNKERTYVLVKNASNAHLKFSSRFNEPFKIISLEKSSPNSCENSTYSLLTNSQLWNSYSYVLVAPTEATKTQRRNRPTEKNSEITYTLSDSTIFTTRKEKYLKKIENVSHQNISKIAKAAKLLKSFHMCDARESLSDTERATIDKNLDYLYPSSCSAKVLHVKPKKSEVLQINPSYFVVLNNEKTQPIEKVKTKNLSTTKDWQQASSVRVEEWVKNIERTENTLNRLRKKISSLSTILREAGQKRVSHNIEQQFYKPLTIADTSNFINFTKEQYCCHMTENNQHKQQTYMLPGNQSTLLCVSSTAPSEASDQQETVRCDCRSMQKQTIRCPCSQFHKVGSIPNSVALNNKPSHSDKFPCIPSVPLHLLVPHAVI